jgi:hypothetical protein
MERKFSLEGWGMTMKLLTMFLTISFAACPAIASAAEKNVILVTARPVDAKLIRRDDTRGALVAPDTYRVVLDNVQVVQGDRSVLPRKMSIDLEANQIEEMLKYPLIHLSIDVSKAKRRVLYWERVISLACVPESLVDDQYRKMYFNDPWGDPGTQCRFLRGYEAPPE